MRCWECFKVIIIPDLPELTPAAKLLTSVVEAMCNSCGSRYTIMTKQVSGRRERKQPFDGDSDRRRGWE